MLKFELHVYGKMSKIFVALILKKFKGWEQAQFMCTASG